MEKKKRWRVEAIENYQSYNGMERMQWIPFMYLYWVMATAHRGGPRPRPLRPPPRAPTRARTQIFGVKIGDIGKKISFIIFLDF